MLPLFRSYAVSVDHGGPMDARPVLTVMKLMGALYRMNPSGSDEARAGPVSQAFTCAGSYSLSSVGSSLVIKYKNPFTGFTATLPHFAPPLWPGNQHIPLHLCGLHN